MELQKWPTNQMDKLADLLSILAVVGTTSSDGLSEILKRIDNALVLKGR